MKTISIYKLGLLGLLVFAFSACSDKDEEVVPVTPVLEPKLEILTDPHSFSFTSAGNTAQVLLFNANQDWTVDLTAEAGVDYSWLTLFQREGHYGDSIRVWVAAASNNDYDARRAEFVLNSGQFSETFTVYQAQKDAVVLTDPKALENLSSDEHIVPIDFRYNVDDYDVQIQSDGGKWISRTENQAKVLTRSMVDGRIWLKIDANEKFDIRKGSITIMDKNNKETKAVMNVFQYGLAKPVIRVTNAAQLEKLTAHAQQIQLNLETENVISVVDQLTIDIPSTERGWLSFEKNEDGSGYILNVEENTGGERSATIKVCAKADHNVGTEIVVTQSAAEGVTVTITNKDVLKETLDKLGGTLSVKFQSMVDDWDAKVESTTGGELDWIRIVNKKMPSQILLTYDANPTLRSRAAVIKVFPAGNEGKADKVTVIEAAGTLIIVTGSLQQTLNNLVQDSIFESVASITSLELKGNLSNSDWSLLKNMCTAGKGYNLQHLDLTEVTNENMAANQFNGCTLLRSIVFPKAMRTNGERVCQGCTELTSAKFHEGVTYICNHFFNNDSKLNEIWLPSTLQYLYGSSFEKCSGIRKIHIQSLPLQILNVARSPSQPTTNSGVFLNISNNAVPKTCTLYVRSEYMEYFKNPDPQHVVNMHLADYLSGLTATSDEWLKSTKTFDWKPSTAILRDNFVWANAATTIIAEDSWE